MLYLQILPFRKGASLDYILVEIMQFLHFFTFSTLRILMYYFQHIIEHQLVAVSKEFINFFFLNFKMWHPRCIMSLATGI
jgi:hypothetical protein